MDVRANPRVCLCVCLWGGEGGRRDVKGPGSVSVCMWGKREGRRKRLESPRVCVCRGGEGGRRDAHPGGRRVPRNVSSSMSGRTMAYGPPSSSSSSRNCVSGGMSFARTPHSGVIHQSLHRAAARKRRHLSCNTRWHVYHCQGLDIDATKLSCSDQSAHVACSGRIKRRLWPALIDSTRRISPAPADLNGENGLLRSAEAVHVVCSGSNKR